uniref:Disease resistance R13L4/SHOC-2-like LRR domain-containing protein n=1 Tax=Salix viminalis TaxID=40686 RepID=A0A6N2K1A8_SALVM
MHPWLRHLAISLAQKAELFEFDSSGTPADLARSSECRRECLVLGGNNSLADPSRNVENLLTVFNVSEQYLDLNPDWLSKLKKVEESLERLEGSKALEYLSLRGISLITSIPASIGELLSLEILDLRACHNLEELPSEIESLTRLTHLDVSDCPFIEGMPKELQNLTRLQVLKGFVIGNSKTSCKIDDLVNLKELRRRKLTRLDDGGTDQRWNVEILRLKYLNDFKLNRQQLLLTFPLLGFLDVKCDEGVEYKQDIVLKSRSEIENYCKEKVVEKNAMPAENHNSEERKSLKKIKGR